MSRPAPRPHARAEIALALAGKAGTSFGALGFASLAPFIRDDLGLLRALQRTGQGLDQGAPPTHKDFDNSAWASLEN